MEKIEMEAEGSATEYDPTFQMTLHPHGKILHNVLNSNLSHTHIISCSNTYSAMCVSSSVQTTPHTSNQTLNPKPFLSATVPLRALSDENAKW
jgi:hypothetical protein